jgi:hypothetical protein
VTEPLNVLSEDEPCVACGYNLRGLAADGLCPGCGGEVGRSLQKKLLGFTELGWRKRIANAVVLTWCSDAALFLFTALYYLVKWWPHLFWSFLPLISHADARFILFWAIGWLAAWLITSPEPGKLVLPGAVSARQWVRFFATVESAAAIFIHYRSAPNPWIGGLWYFIDAALLSLWTWTLWSYVNQLCRRLSNSSLGWQASVLKWIRTSVIGARGLYWLCLLAGWSPIAPGKVWILETYFDIESYLIMAFQLWTVIFFWPRFRRALLAGIPRNSVDALR